MALHCVRKKIVQSLALLPSSLNAVLLSGLGRCMYARPNMNATGQRILKESACGIVQRVLGVVRACRSEQTARVLVLARCVELSRALQQKGTNGG